MPDIQPVFKEISIGELEEDPKQPRDNKNTDKDRNRLLVSLEALGLQQPIAVTELAKGQYRIIDGHRRFRCVKELGWKTVPCRVYPQLDPVELERVRFEIQNNRRPWKPLERSKALAQMKQAGKYTDDELAELLFVSRTVVTNSLLLGKQKEEYKNLMEEYDLSESYRTEFIKLRPKLRNIRRMEGEKIVDEITIDEIIKNLFDRVSCSIIKSAKDFRTLGRIFLRATANEVLIYEFLKNPDMTVRDLEQSTVQSGFSLWVENLIKKIGGKKKDGIAFSSQEKEMLIELRDLLIKTV